jgi:hypothetical protein
MEVIPTPKNTFESLFLERLRNKYLKLILKGNDKHIITIPVIDSNILKYTFYSVCSEIAKRDNKSYWEVFHENFSSFIDIIGKFKNKVPWKLIFINRDLAGKVMDIVKYCVRKGKRFNTKSDLIEYVVNCIIKEIREKYEIYVHNLSYRAAISFLREQARASVSWQIYDLSRKNPELMNKVIVLNESDEDEAKYLLA